MSVKPTRITALKFKDIFIRRGEAKLFRLVARFIRDTCVLTGLTLSALLLHGAPAAAASFDCSKSRTSVERTICLVPELSQADDHMKAQYDSAVARSQNPAAVRQSQREWLRLVRNRCDTVGCLTSVYADRMKELRTGAPESASQAVSLMGGRPGLQSGQVEYETSLTHSAVAKWMNQARVLEQAVATLTQYMPQAAIPGLVAKDCPQAAYYLRNQVVVCYAFVDQLFTFQRQQMRQEGGTEAAEAARALTALKFVVFHEVAHSLLARDARDGTLGSDEPRADTFAGVLVLADDTSAAQVREAVFALSRLTSQFDPQSEYTWEQYSDEHPVAQQRFAAFACLAVARTPELASWVSPVLTVDKAKTCSRLWSERLAGAKKLARIH
jgi:uncharacterized protein